MTLTIGADTAQKAGDTAMWTKPENEQYGDELYLAGERVKPGAYHQVGTNRTIVLEREDVLPASLDGRVACYTCVRNVWSDDPKADNLPVSAPMREHVKNGV